MTILSSTELDTGLEAELLATATIITLGGHWGTHGTDEETQAEEAVLLKATGSSGLHGRIVSLSLRSNSRAAGLGRKLLLHTESWFSELLSPV